MVGIAQERLLDLEAGREDPGYKLLFPLAEALNITVVELVGQVEALIPTAH